MSNKRKRCYAEFCEQSVATSPFSSPGSSPTQSDDESDLSSAEYTSYFDEEVEQATKLRKQAESPESADDLDDCIRRVVSFIEKNVMRLPTQPQELAALVTRVCRYTTQLDMSVVFYQLLLNGLIVASPSSPNSYEVPPQLRPWHEVVIWVPDPAPSASAQSSPVSEDFRRGIVSCYDFLRTQAKPGVPFSTTELFQALVPHCQIQHGCETEVVLEALLKREIIWLETADGSESLQVRYNPTACVAKSTVPCSSFVHFQCRESPVAAVAAAM